MSGWEMLRAGYGVFGLTVRYRSFRRTTEEIQAEQVTVLDILEAAEDALITGMNADPWIAEAARAHWRRRRMEIELTYGLPVKIRPGPVVVEPPLPSWTAYPLPPTPPRVGGHVVAVPVVRRVHRPSARGRPVSPRRRPADHRRRDV